MAWKAAIKHRILDIASAEAVVAAGGIEEAIGGLQWSRYGRIAWGRGYVLMKVRENMVEDKSLLNGLQIK